MVVTTQPRRAVKLSLLRSFALFFVAATLAGCSDEPSGPDPRWIEPAASWVLHEDGEPVLYAYAMSDDMSVWERHGDCWRRAEFQLERPQNGMYPAHSGLPNEVIERLPNDVWLLVRGPQEELFIDWDGGGLVMTPGWPAQPGLAECFIPVD